MSGVGSSLQVQPAAGFVRHFIKKGIESSVAIVNLQKTEMHNKGAIEVHDYCDRFLVKLAHKLQISLPQSSISRKLHIVALPNRSSYELTFFDDHGRSIQSSTGFTLISSNGSQKQLSTWPFLLTEEDLGIYSTVHYSLIADGSTHECSLASLLSEAKNHQIEYRAETSHF